MTCNNCVLCVTNMAHKTMTRKHSMYSEMDEYINKMMKLIEEDGDSFAKKAEMYYQKRPELITIVEEVQRIYRSLAERYDHDHANGELRRGIPCDRQSRGSETPSPATSPVRRRHTRRRSTTRAPGFDYFLGGSGGGGSSGNVSDLCDESSVLDSGSESDDSSFKNYLTMASRDEEQGLRRRIVELELELQRCKSINDNIERKHNRIARSLEAEVMEAMGNITPHKLHESEKAVTRLRQELVSKETCMQQMLDRVVRYEMDILERDEEIENLKEAMMDRSERGFGGNERLQAELARLAEKLRRVELERDNLTKSLEALQLNYDALMVEKYNCEEELRLKENQIDEMEEHLHNMNMEHANMIAEAEWARRSTDSLHLRIKELEREVEKKQQIIIEAADEKLEAIRQLTISVEHYRKGYHRLREVVVGHKTPLEAPSS